MRLLKDRIPLYLIFKLKVSIMPKERKKERKLIINIVDIASIIINNYQFDYLQFHTILPFTILRIFFKKNKKIEHLRIFVVTGKTLKHLLFSKESGYNSSYSSQ